MEAKKSQRELSEMHYDMGKKKEKEIKKAWEEYCEKVEEMNEMIENKIYGEVCEHFKKYVLPNHKTLGGKEKEKHEKITTRYIVKKITSPLDESVKKTDETFIQLMKEYGGTETLRERVLKNAVKPLLKNEIERAYEISVQTGKENV